MSALNTEIEQLKKTIARTQNKIQSFETLYGKMDREKLYGKIDDMTLVEWEGEIMVLELLEKKLLDFQSEEN